MTPTSDNSNTTYTLDRKSLPTALSANYLLATRAQKGFTAKNTKYRKEAVTKRLWTLSSSRSLSERTSAHAARMIHSTIVRPLYDYGWTVAGINDEIKVIVKVIESRLFSILLRKKVNFRAKQVRKLCGLSRIASPISYMIPLNKNLVVNLQTTSMLDTTPKATRTELTAGMQERLRQQTLADKNDKKFNTALVIPRNCRSLQLCEQRMVTRSHIPEKATTTWKTIATRPSRTLVHPTSLVHGHPLPLGNILGTT